MKFLNMWGHPWVVGILPAARVIRSLEQIIEWRGKPKIIRCDNGPEYSSGALLVWAERHKMCIQHIQPGKPQQTTYVGRYNRTVRYAWLTRALFDSIKQAQAALKRDRIDRHGGPLSLKT